MARPEKLLFTGQRTFTVTISLPSSKKRGFANLFSRKPDAPRTSPAARKQLDGQQVAKLFDKNAAKPQDLRPAKMNANEKYESAQLNDLRGALYKD